MENDKISLIDKNEDEVLDIYYEISKDIELQKIIFEECKDLETAKSIYKKKLDKNNE